MPRERATASASAVASRTTGRTGSPPSATLTPLGVCGGGNAARRSSAASRQPISGKSIHNGAASQGSQNPQHRRDEAAGSEAGERGAGRVGAGMVVTGRSGARGAAVCGDRQPVR